MTLSRWKCIFWAGSGLLFCMTTSTVQAGWPYSDRYEAWVQHHDFPLGSWYEGENPHPRRTVQERVDRYRQAGLTRLPTFWSTKARPIVEHMDAIGMDWQILVDNVQYQTFINDAFTIGDGPASILVFDEPNNAELPEVAERIHWAQQQTQVGVPHAEAPLVYANLSASGTDLDQYITQANPDVLSYDRYPLFLDGTTNPSYFDEMNRIRDKSLQYKIPMWMIQQAWSRTSSPDSELLRMPSASDMRFQAFSFLAHGGLGIDYFIYLTVSFPDAVIDYDTNQPSPVYDAIADMNPEILNLAKTLPVLRPVGDVEFLGDAISEFDNVTAFQSTSSRNLFNIEGVDSGLVSFFVDEFGEDYFMIVNLLHGADLDKSDTEDSMVLFFDPAITSVQRLNRLTGEVDVLETIDNPSGGNRYLLLTLEGGTGDLFKYNTGADFAMLTTIPEPISAGAWSVIASVLVWRRKTQAYRNVRELFFDEGRS